MSFFIEPIERLNLEPEIERVLKTLKPYSFFKGGVARDALLKKFTPPNLTRSSKPILDFDFVVFGVDLEWDDWGDEYVVFNEEQRKEYSRLNKLGDVEDHWSIKEYFKSRDNTLNQVLLGKNGLYYTGEAKKSSCDMVVGMTSDLRPRAVLRNILFALRLGHDYPKANVKKALRDASIIDQLIPLFKAYKLGLEWDYFKYLSQFSRDVRRHTDSDFYMISLLKKFEGERGRSFSPKTTEDKSILKEIIKRTRYEL